MVPDGGGVVRWTALVQQHTVGQVLVEVSTLHVLCDHAERIAAHTHTQQTNDVRILQTRQDLHLLQEVIPERERERERDSINIEYHSNL